MKLSSLPARSTCLVLFAALPIFGSAQQATDYRGGDFDAPALGDDLRGHSEALRGNRQAIPGSASSGNPGSAAIRREQGSGYPSTGAYGAGPGDNKNPSKAESFLLYRKIIDSPVSTVGGAKVGQDTAGRVNRLGNNPVEYSRGGRVTRFAGESIDYSTSGSIVRFGGEIVHYDSNGRPVMVGRERLGYDSSGRLTYVGKERVDYDRSGRISRIGNKPLSYDAHGRLKGYGDRRVEYRR